MPGEVATMDHDGSGATEPIAEEVRGDASEDLTARGGLHPAEGEVPIIEVAFKEGIWWSIPQEMSAQLYAFHAIGQDAAYTWDWGEAGRLGSWKPEGENTHINRYTIDFLSRIQANIDNGRKRSIRIVWVRREDIKPQFTGQLPTNAQ